MEKGNANAQDLNRSLLITNEPVYLPPSVPATPETHDNVNGGGVLSTWPRTKPRSTYSIHMHFYELVENWSINPVRGFNGRVEIDPRAESRGISAVIFDHPSDLENFVAYFELQDFVLGRFAFAEPGGNRVFSVQLRNHFPTPDAHAFLETFLSALDRIAGIQNERNRAIAVDGGRIGYITSQYFNTREKIQLDHIAHARRALGKSGKEG